VATDYSSDWSYNRLCDGYTPEEGLTKIIHVEMLNFQPNKPKGIHKLRFTEEKDWSSARCNLTYIKNKNYQRIYTAFQFDLATQYLALVARALRLAGVMSRLASARGFLINGRRSFWGAT
jgi:hypothetical protein